MIFSYGDGEYCEGDRNIKGQIILAEHKLYLKGPQGDLTETYIPFEKIEKIKKSLSGVEIHIRPSLMVRYIVLLKGEKTHLADLVKDIVKRRGLRKKFLKKEWFDEMD